MDSTEYQKQAIRTMRSDLSAEEKISNCIFGIAGEVGEIIDLYKKERFHGRITSGEEYEKEIGDVLWYVANLCTLTDFPFEYAGSSVSIREAHDESVEDSLKRLCREAAQFDHIDPERVFTSLVYLAKKLGCRPIETIMDLNIEKPKARYPDRFTTEASIERRDER